MTQLKVLNTLTKKVEEIKISNNTLKWYVCGPTVYDSPHLGHARTYIVFDTMRRILEDLYGIEVVYVMNITDIDDKIINKGNELLKEKSNIDSLLSNLKLDEKNFSNENMKASLFIATKYENEFFTEMEKLNVKKPTYITRVRDYIEKIIAFIKKIIDNGYGYESNESVYFDLKKYKEKHALFYSTDKSINDDETQSTEKKNSIDFALWKKSKDNELFYESPWGKGRPGWHIECSAMASDIFPDGMDMHSGAVDLKFPHHENEIIQSKAALGLDSWVKYFVHSGHLEIEGLKMSKSLKNFITIPQILKTHSPRTVRLLFLLSPYDSSMIYSESSFEFASKIENKLFNFLSKCESLKDSFKGMNDSDRVVLSKLEGIKKLVREYLENNFAIHKVINLLYEFTIECNKCFDEIQPTVLRSCSQYVHKILSSFGLIFDSGEKSDDKELEYVELISNIRTDIKKLAKDKAPYTKFYEACDVIRENVKQKGFLIEDKGSISTIRRKL